MDLSRPSLAGMILWCIKETRSMNYKAKALGYLIPLAIVDAVLPVPILGLLLVYVVLARPSWFLSLTDQIYGR